MPFLKPDSPPIRLFTTPHLRVIIFYNSTTYQGGAALKEYEKPELIEYESLKDATGLQQQPST
jgi:hypothetical protein